MSKPLRDTETIRAAKLKALAEITGTLLSGGYDGSEGHTGSPDTTFTDFGEVCGIAEWLVGRLQAAENEIERLATGSEISALRQMVENQAATITETDARLQAAEQDADLQAHAYDEQRDRAVAAERALQAAAQEREGRVLVGQVEWDAIERRLDVLDTALRAMWQRFVLGRDGVDAVPLADAALSVSPAPQERP